MSGSSLDGLDVCVSTFKLTTDGWTYVISHSETFPLPESLANQLRMSDQLNEKELQSLDHTYGDWIGHQLLNTIQSNNPAPVLIGVHGHTVFHDPVHQKISVQIGNGKVISELTGVEVVDNFRMHDIQLGGQGAPLVPAGEYHLFPSHHAFLNLGGICNLSIHQPNYILAWDIAPCNQVFNYFAKQLGYEYDAGGHLSEGGKFSTDWAEYLSSLDYFQKKPPKSLGNQWTREVLKKAPDNPQDALSTYVAILAREIARAIQRDHTIKSVLITGGGAYNQALIAALNHQLNGSIKLEIPSDEIVEYKEALIFGFLALLRKLNIPNVFASATGAQRDSISGDLHSVV